MYVDLFKAFDTINHNLLFAKIRAYGFLTSSLNLLYSYLKYRTQKVVINNKTISSEVVIAGVLQGSFDGPLLFNLFINDLILFLYTTVLSNHEITTTFMLSVMIKKKPKEHLSKTFRQ